MSQQQAFSLYIQFPKKITVVEAISYSIDEFNNKITSNRLKNKPELYQITKASPINGGPERTKGIITNTPSIKVFNPNHRLYDFGERNLCLMIRKGSESGEREAFANTSSQYSFATSGSLMEGSTHSRWQKLKEGRMVRLDEQQSESDKESMYDRVEELARLV